MKKPDDGGHAFPTLFIEPEHGTGYGGMTLRDYLVAQIAGGDAAASDAENSGWDSSISDEKIHKRVRLYYRIADAILAARGKPVA